MFGQRTFDAVLISLILAIVLAVILGTVVEYLNRAREAGLAWPISADLDDDLGRMLFPAHPSNLIDAGYLTAILAIPDRKESDASEGDFHT